jgi:hypothetical protein
MASPIINDSVYLVVILHSTGKHMVTPNGLNNEGEVASGDVGVIVV